MIMLNDWKKLPETEKRTQVAAFVADLAPYEVELHLMTDPALPKKYGKAIKAVGGRYSESRGMGSLHRYVTLPSTARGLINTLVTEFGFWHGARSNDKVTMIAKPTHDKLPTHVAVGGVTKVLTDSDPITAFEHKLARKVFAARAEGESCGALTHAEIAAHTQALAKQTARTEAQHRLAEVLYAAKPTTLDEFHTIVAALKAYAKNVDGINVNNNVALTYLNASEAMLSRMEKAHAVFDVLVRNSPSLDAALGEILAEGAAS